MTTHVAFKTSADLGGSSVEVPARVFEIIAESASNAATTITAQQNEVAVISSTADIHVEFGSAPNAATSKREMVTAGSTRYFLVNAGDKVAVVTI